MAHITLSAAQQWLETTKLTLTVLDSDLENSASNYVLSRLSVVYPNEVTTWTSTANTPALVQQVISMYYAGWLYNRQYSEDSDGGNPWADKLIGMADMMLAGIASGLMDLTDVPSTLSATNGLTFFPDDTTGATQQYDAAGNSIGGETSEDVKFTMGVVW